jgi:hypothetical protein
MMIERTDDAELSGVSLLRELMLIMHAIMRGGPWECKRERKLFQNNNLFNFSLGIENLKT